MADSIPALQSQIEVKSKELEEQTKIVNKLRKQVEDGKGQILQLKSDLSDTQQQSESLSRDLKDAQSTIRAAESRHVKDAQTISEKESDIQRLINESHRQKHEIEVLKAEVQRVSSIKWYQKLVGKK